MVTVTETRTRKLESSADIAGYLSETFGRMATETDFAPGEVVAIVERAGLTADFGAGDVAVMLCDLPGSTYCSVLGLMPSGVFVTVSSATSNFAKRPA